MIPDLRDAKSLLEKKLGGILESTANVSPEDAWTKQILHIWTLQPSWTNTVQAACFNASYSGRAPVCSQKIS